jgi:hypothetical protein
MSNKPLVLKDAVNDEEFLTMCLEICAKDPLMFESELSIDEKEYDNQEFERDAFFLASKVVVWYILLKHKGLSEPEVQDKFMEMVVDHILTEQVKKGNVQVDFDTDGEIRYSITDKGMGVVFNSPLMKNMQDKAKKKDEE